MWVVIDTESSEVFGPFASKEAADDWALNAIGTDDVWVARMTDPT